VSTHKAVDNKAPDQIFPYSDNTEIRQQIWVTRELLNQTAPKPFCGKKQVNTTHSVLEFCTERFVTSAPWEFTLRKN